MNVNTKWLILLVIILSVSNVNAKLFSIENTYTPPFAGCSITGCTMQGSIDMNGYIIYNATFENATFAENDPIFRANNASIWAAINNNTQLIYSVNDSLFTLIYLVNDTLYAELDNYYTITEIQNLYYNQTESDNRFYPLNSNPAGYINESFGNSTYYPLNSNPNNFLNSSTLNITNVTDSLYVKIPGDTMTGDLNMSNNSILDVDVLSVHNITGRSPIFVSSEIIASDTITATTFFGNIQGTNGTIFGLTITNGTASNLRVSDSAVFNTSLIPEMNDTWSIGEGPDKYWKSLYVNNLVAANISSPDLTNIYNLISAVNDSILYPSGEYLYNDSNYFYVNETKLNNTINNISENRYLQYIDYVNVTSGNGYLISSNTINYLITNVKVNGIGTSYRSEVTEYPITTNIIDKNRIPHNQNWSIEKNYGINSQVATNITNANIDGIYQVVIDYIDNGLN